MIYFDNAATTKPIEESLNKFKEINVERFFNPSASYSISFDLFKDLNEVRKGFIKLLDGKADDKIIFTSGATESNNLAIFGSATNKQKKYLFSMGEHPSVYNCACELKNKGYNVEFIPLQKNGQINYQKFEDLCDESVCFVSTMFVNNETGAINDLVKIRKIIDSKTQNCIFHVDAVQGFCKKLLSVTEAKINLCSISAHKIGGIKGVGALYVSNKTKIKNVNFGGDQEFGFRSGTVNAAAIFSFYEAAKITFENLEKNFNYLTEIKQNLVSKLQNIKNCIIVSEESCSPYILSIIFEGNRGETIMRFLDSNQIFVSTGSACSSSKIGNRILEAMGYSKKQVMGAIRVSFSPLNNIEETNILVEKLKLYIKEINT